ncbi:nitroreductase family protein [Tissierella sp. Yu-01]|uniref:nitroreductase family protein n=1 Tax=Tissierella sp. Yu-01 TaxID=3035694 RepID=UPI00240E4511|nr:nitroreductase family protein [Tissierella sp. Yu-01]WFA10245.1 nitroreductase family protein [Tissierella sp. Yu-01]
MRINNFLMDRRSVRDFKKNRNVNSEILDQIKIILKELEKEYSEGGFEFKLYENGENIYDGLEGLAGYSGVMVESPHYIAVDLKDKDDKTVIFSAYYMEKLVTKLIELELDTCWVSVYDVDKSKRKELFGDSTNEINFILAFGYPKRGNPLIKKPFSERMGVEELVYDKVLEKRITLEYLEQRGLADTFYYLRFAPSIKNRQPWRFIVTEDKVHLLVKYEEGKNPPLIDAGIAMYYFEALQELQGTRHKWSLLDGFIHEGNTNYKYIAEYQL